MDQNSSSSTEQMQRADLISPPLPDIHFLAPHLAKRLGKSLHFLYVQPDNCAVFFEPMPKFRCCNSASATVSSSISPR